MAGKLHAHVGLFKVGLELFSAAGPALVHGLAMRGDGVFLDLKFHDIPNTVRAAAREAAQMGVRMFNVHATGGRKMMEAAREGVEATGPGANRPLLLAVTVLTSLAAEDFREVGLAGEPTEAVTRLARLARRAGMDGVVASAREAAAIRAACGHGFVIVTPGIRPAAATAQDQARVATPSQAVQDGADFLVVGRPITSAADPVAAADAVVAEIGAALAKHGPDIPHRV